MLTVLEHVLLARTVGKKDDDLHRRRAARRVAARRPGPPADAAEKMQACRCDRRRDFDPLREIIREIPAAGPTLQRDQVGAARGPRRVHHEERHAGHGHVPELVQRHRLVAFLFAAEPAAAVRRVGRAQIDDAELLVVAIAGEEREDVAQHFGAQRLEPLGHERAARILARRNLFLLDLHVAGRTAQREARGVFARNHAGERLPLARGDVPLPEAGVDFAVGIDDVGQQLGAAVCAHAVQRRPGLALADVPQLVATRAGTREQHLAQRTVARLLDLRQQRRDDVALRLRGR